MWPVEREFASREFVGLGTSIACAELIRGGVTTFNDMYFYEEEVDVAVAGLLTLLEPMMIVLMGGVVGFIALAILMPLIQMNQLVE